MTHVSRGFTILVLSAVTVPLFVGSKVHCAEAMEAHAVNTKTRCDVAFICGYVAFAQ